MSPLSNDPLGIQNVSGFYGPGSWIAWYLTLATSRSQSSGTITLTISTISAICSTSTGPQSMLYDCLYKIPRTLPTEPQYSLQKTQFGCRTSGNMVGNCTCNIAVGDDFLSERCHICRPRAKDQTPLHAACARHALSLDCKHCHLQMRTQYRI
jgi:hypothetical protein